MNGNTFFFRLAKTISQDFTHDGFTTSKEKAELFASFCLTKSRLNPTADFSPSSIESVSYAMPDFKLTAKHILKILYSVILTLTSIASRLFQISLTMVTYLLTVGNSLNITHSKKRFQISFL